MRAGGIVFGLMLGLATPAFAQVPPPPESGPTIGPIIRMQHIAVQSIGAGPPLILIPDLAGPASIWTPHLERLAEAHHVLLVEANGHEPVTVAQVVADLSRYIEGERLGPVLILGHGSGATVGHAMAREHPAQVVRVGIIANPMPPERGRAEIDAFLAR